MDPVLLGARVLLAAVFVVAAVTKLSDRAGTRQAVIDFGVPSRLAAPVAMLLPIAELAVAALLLPIATAWYGALGALALLALFCLGVGVNLLRGKQPNCHCFGQLYSEPIGWKTLGRNLLLMAVAIFIIGVGYGDPGTSVVAWLGGLSTTAVVGLMVAVGLSTAVAILGWLVLHLMQQNGRILGRLEHLEGLLTPGADSSEPASSQPRVGLPIGAPAPAFSLGGLYGDMLTLDALRAGGTPVLLLFSDPGCGPCNTLLPDVGRWQREHRGTLTVAVVSRGTVEANRRKCREHGITTTMLQEDHEVAERYDVHGTPSAVIVNPDGTVGSDLAQGPDAIRRLVNRTVGLPVTAGRNGNSAGQEKSLPQPAGQPVAALGIGDDAPDITLTGVDGHVITMSSFHGNPTLVLFWNPGCGYCQRMLDDLKDWEAHRPEDAPTLLVVSTGAADVNRAMDLRSTVVLDHDFTVGRLFGASGTPSALLLDADGKVASPMMVGAPAVMGLAVGQSAT